MDFKKNQEVILKIDDLGNNGEGIGHVDGYALFVKEVLPGETIRAGIMKCKKNYGFARLLEVLEPSPDRVEPQCPAARPCGGCTLQHLSYNAQLRYKENKVKNCLTRIGGVDLTTVEWLPILGMQEETPWHYRDKAQFPVREQLDENGKPHAVTGFYAGHSHRVIPMTDCAIQAPIMREILEIVLAWMDNNNIPAYNEETRVRPVIEAIADMGFKIILVNDGSSDGTLDVLKDVQGKYPENIFIYSHVINRGVGLAMQTGFEAVLKYNPKYIVNIDADGQHSVDDLERVLEPLIAGRAEAVIGVRSLSDMPKSKNFGNSVMNILTHIFYGVNVSDSQTGFRALTRSALDKISINAQGYLISSEFIREINDNNIPFEEVTIETIYTPETQAKGTNYKVGIKILFTMIRHKLFD